MNDLIKTENAAPLGKSVLRAGKAAQFKLPIDGKIRPGIKILTKQYSQNKEAVNIYNRGMAKGVGFGAIESAIMKKLKLDKSPMRPINTEYFTVHKSDFRDPANADRIMELYGEDRGDGKQLYRFPVMFPVDDIMSVLPHELACFTFNQKQYWSEYDEKGVRYCYQRGEPKKINGKIIRTLGGRPKVKRTDINPDGLCLEEECPQFQKGDCRMRGAFQFYVPGLSGAGVISLPSTSFYSIDGAIDVLNLIGEARNGKISGTLNGKPIFWISKVEEKVSMLDMKTGKSVKTDQYIIKLEADINMQQVFSMQEDDFMLEEGIGAVAVLEGTVNELELDEPLPIEGEVVEPEPEVKPADVRKQVFALRNEHGYDDTQFMSFLVKKYGGDWGLSVDAMIVIMDDIKADPEKFRAEMESK